MVSWQDTVICKNTQILYIYKIYRNYYLAYVQAICWLFHWMPISPCLIFCHLNLNYVNKFKKKTYLSTAINPPSPPTLCLCIRDGSKYGIIKSHFNYER